MDQNGIDMRRNVNKDFYVRKKELFYCSFNFSKIVNESLLLRLLILLSRYYFDYHIHDGDCKEKKAWKEYAINTELTFNKEIGKTLYISPLVNIQQEEKVEKVYMDDGLTFSFYWDQRGECYTLLFNYYIDVVTDKVYLLKDGEYLEVDQRVAAKRNRKILSECLQAIEALLEGEIVETITDYHLTKDSVYKYGITEGARHETGHMGLC